MSSLKKTIMLLTFVSSTLLAQNFTFPITVTDGTVTQVVTIGAHENGTDEYDQDLDIPAPPAPPIGSFDTRLTWMGEEYYTDIRDTSLNYKIFLLKYRPSTDAEIVLRWDSSTVNALGIFHIMDDTGDPNFILDMSTTDSLLVSSGQDIKDSCIIFINPGGVVAISDNSFQPGNFVLSQNYPNPFNPKTKINYELPFSKYVELSVYNSIGQKIAVLVNKKQEAGKYEVDFDGSSLASGIYLYQIRAGKYVSTKKMVLCK